MLRQHNYGALPCFKKITCSTFNIEILKSALFFRKNLCNNITIKGRKLNGIT